MPLVDSRPGGIPRSVSTRATPRPDNTAAGTYNVMAHCRASIDPKLLELQTGRLHYMHKPRYACMLLPARIHNNLTTATCSQRRKKGHSYLPPLDVVGGIWRSFGGAA